MIITRAFVNPELMIAQGVMAFGIFVDIDPEWFNIGAEMIDMIGSLPYRDERDYGRSLKAMDILLDKAKSLGIMCHVHVDKFNTPTEKETEQLCDKTIEHGMQGRVVGIHGIYRNPSARISLSAV